MVLLLAGGDLEYLGVTVYGSINVELSFEEVDMV